MKKGDRGPEGWPGENLYLFNRGHVGMMTRRQGVEPKKITVYRVQITELVRGYVDKGLGGGSAAPTFRPPPLAPLSPCLG